MAQMSLSRWRASIRALVQGGAWRWALAVGFAVALGGGVWVYDVFGPRIHASWPHWKSGGKPWLRETVLWIEFLASITLTVAILCWFTALYFCLLCAMLYSLPHLFHWFSRHVSPERRFHQIVHRLDALVERDWVLGTILNLIVSGMALVTVTIILERPLDYWDIGIQAVIAAAIELIVLQVLFAKGRLGWPARKVS